jgi:pyridoxal phosphate enzyme (YggS family)
MAPTVAEVEDRLEAIHRRIAERARGPVRVVAVTKGFPAETIEVAAAAGCTDIGENYGQELLAKAPVLDALDDRPDVHFIGRLQSNKVRAVVRLVDLWDSLDRSSLVDEVARRAPGARVLIQVNATGEAGKGGCPIDETGALVGRADARGLRVEGLMTVGPTEGGPAAARPAFVAVRRLVDELGLPQCSMGMSDDLDVALEAGSTQVRIGSLLFGERPRP